MIKVELIYDQDCPNVNQAREQLQLAFSEVGLPPQWEELDRRDPAAPSYVRYYGSPTILVNGKDVAVRAKTQGADCCRIYVDPEGQIQKVPSVELIVSALREYGRKIVTSNQRQRKSHWYGNLAALPGIGVALLPAGICPACWPAYAGLLGSLGLGFMIDNDYLLPLTVVFLLAAMAALGFRARNRHGYGPVALGVASSVMIIIGKFFINSSLVTYPGIALLIIASVWNSWPRKRIDSVSCPHCVPTGDTVKIGNPNRLERS